MRGSGMRLRLGGALLALACTNATLPDVPATAIAAVVVDPPASTIVVGSALPLQAQVQDAGGALVASTSVTWTVRDPVVASVSTSGVVTALAPGTTLIAANVNGRSGIATITVQKVPVASVGVRPSRVELVIGARTQLTAVAYDAAQNVVGDRAVVWSSSSESVVTVDASGTITAVSAGTAVVTGTIDGKSEGATVVVSAGPVASVSVTPGAVAMIAGQTSQLAVTLRDASGTLVSGRAVVWSSANTGVALVSAAGVVSAIGAGSATITATSEGRGGSAVVTVSTPAAPPVPVATVSLSPSSVTIAPGQSTALAATTRAANGTTLAARVVTWSSSNPMAASVSNAGVVTGVATGTTTITASSEGRTTTAAVVVKPGAAASVAVTPTPVSVRLDRSVQLSASAKDAYGNAVTGRAFTWKSSDTGLATVTSSGLVSANDKKTGAVTITATLDGSTSQSVVSVTR